MPKKKHIFELAGGLGNQLFQISAARELVEDPMFDVSMLRNPFLRHPVDLSGIVKDEQSIDIAKMEGMLLWRLKNAFYTRISKLNRSGRVGSRLFLEDKDLSLLELKEFLASSRKQLRIRGYFQDSQFVSHRQIEFFRKQISLPTKTLLNQLDLESTEPFTAVHYRLGDLVGLGKTLPTTYFQRAFEALLGRNSIHRKILLFSDNLQLAMRNLNPVASQLGLNLKPASVRNPREMISVFGLADSSIISNSTLAWWAIKLSSSAKIVVSPLDWRNGDLSHRLVDDSWLVIDE